MGVARLRTSRGAFGVTQLPLEDPELAAIVKSQLTHGPCGPDYPNALCMRDGKCSKGFPKRWYESNVLAEDSYPEHARPKNGQTWSNGRFTFDNRWVVPYNPYLTKKYSAYINVEGSDRASAAVEDQHDEIKMTIQGRFISPVQAIWRLSAYTTHEEKPAVMLLPYHLKGEHQVSFGRNMTGAKVAAAIKPQSSIFMDWMRYNAANTDGRHLCYSDFPLFYTYVKRRG
ncbi:hypothetical protein EPUL_001545 [Erysiphe pulchra]|uniref:Uncharacterized protein n=1 Tax=Erysiphe pulchra TaxID=225359 RepID=A0A2S4PUY7_9PEZI|nr:hypothetical protein EPUL_001545 [Erysiphe pulchra]